LPVALRPLASLRLTVTLLAFAMVLIFVGTIAQTRLGVWQAVDQYFRSPIAWVDPSLFIPGEGPPTEIPFRLPLPGGLTLVVLLIVNLFAAHSVRRRTLLKQPGLLVLHAGLIVLLGGELATGFLSEEGLMSIDEGESSAIIEDIREVELAVIDRSDPERDRVVTAPQSMLVRAARSGEPIDHEAFPFEIAVDQWMPNAALLVAQGETPADHGVGLEAMAQQRPRVTGVEGSRADEPAAYVTLTHEGERLGTWLVSAALIEPQTVEAGGKTYGLSLQYARTYLPYRLHLNDFRHDVFTGTSIPRNFSSDIRLVDQSRNTDRDVRIWMNNPLRYRGRTFYQASYKPDGSGTVLQVVRNPAWTLPYIACALVGGGMTWHFVASLTGFLRKRRERERRTIDAAQPGGTRPRWPLLLGLIGVLLTLAPAFTPSPARDFDLRTFGVIPVSAGGRLKPMDTAARSLLMAVGGRRSAEGADGREIPAIAYLLDLIARPERVGDVAVVRVDHPDLLSLIGLAPEESGRVPLSVIEPRWEAIIEQARRAASLDARERDAFQRAVLELHDRVNLVLAHAQMRAPYAIPPLGPEGSWRPFHEAFLDDRAAEEPHPSVAYFVAMMTAASDGEAERFNSAAQDYLALLERSMPGVVRKAQIETVFNRISPFTGALALYLLAFVGVCASLGLRARSSDASGWAERVRLGSIALLVAAAIVHTAALAIRIYLQERPPVTNLYSSAVFVGWAAALAGLFIERLFPLGVAALGSSAIGVGALVVAHNLGDDGDTMQMMQAVLDSNFWLATHVITITLGYSATFLAGAIGAVYLLGRIFTSAIDRERERTFGRMIFGVVCFALLLSFVGTVLGGIWADQSWGRFWGWDPKENGAALIVLINAIILHARWGGLVRARGITMLAVGGNIVTAWSWFGTNMLGIGLHAYGFMDSAAMWLVAFVLSQAALIVGGAFLPEQAPRTARDSARTEDDPLS